MRAPCARSALSIAAFEMHPPGSSPASSISAVAGPVETRQHQVQVYRERVHRHDFAGLRADEFRQMPAYFAVVRQPRMFALKMRFDRELRPGIKLVEQRRARSTRLQAE
jgi:hypothetical protein